jgi:CRP/FNR family cyclic AMP-dependent transcriptional regulator
MAVATGQNRWPQNPIFDALDDRARAALKAASRYAEYTTGEFLLVEHDPGAHVFLLESGAARIFHLSPSGLEVAVMFCRAPSLFGEIEVLLDIAHIENVVALEPSACWLVPKAHFKSVLESSAKVTTALLKDTCAKLAMASHNQKALASQTVATRLATLLVAYAQFDGKRVGDITVLNASLTQDRMAEALGVTRRAVAREVDRWRKAGIFQRGKTGSYEIRNLAVLSREAAPEQIGLTYDSARGLIVMKSDM